MVISRVLIILLIFNSILNLYGQDCKSCSKFYYSLSYQSDSLDIHSKSNHVFALIINDNTSIFTDIQNKKADSLETIIWNNYNKNSTSISFKGIPNAKFKYYIAKDLSVIDKPVKIYDKIGSGNYMYEDATKIEWQLFNNKKNIAGFSCQMAKTKVFGRTFIAWFASEVPINDGPYKFWGLPGLIIELYDEKKYFVFSLIRYQKQDFDVLTNIPELRLRKLIITSKDKFVRAKKNYKEGIVSRIKNSAISGNVGEERIRQIQESIKKNNNPIELTN